MKAPRVRHLVSRAISAWGARLLLRRASVLMLAVAFAGCGGAAEPPVRGESAAPLARAAAEPSPTPPASPTSVPEVEPARPLRVVVIEHAPLRAAGVDYFLEQNGVAFDLIKVYEGEPLPPWQDYDAIISSGGPMSPEEFDDPRYSFLQAEQDYVLEAIAAGKGFLGLCLGEQLLAHYLGGEVVRGDQAEVGWLPVTLTPEGEDDPLFQGVSSEFFVFQYHVDQVVRLPDGAVRLASSPLSPVQAFRYRDLPVWGVQFHPEIRPTLAAEILSRSGRLAPEGGDRDAMIQLGFQIYSEAQETLFRNFFREVGRSLVD